MTRRTVHIPDELDNRVIETTTVEDSYSGVVQEALAAYLDEIEGGQSADDAIEA